MRAPGFTQQIGQLAELTFVQVAQLSAVAFADLGRDSIEQRQPFIGDSDEHRTPISVQPLALDKTALAQSVHHASDIGSAGYELARKRQSGNLLRLGCA